MMAIKLHGWKTIRELRLCTAAGLINPMEFKILLAPQVFLDQGTTEDDDDEEVTQIKKPSSKKKEKEGAKPVVGFCPTEPEED